MKLGYTIPGDICIFPQKAPIGPFINFQPFAAFSVTTDQAEY